MNDNLLLNHLLREGITPSFSFPLDVCEFKGEGRVKGVRNVWPNMQQDLKKALSEFSPGKIITVDGEKYKVEGLSFFNPPNKVHRARHVFKEKFSDENKNLKWYNRCTQPNCGYVENLLDKKSEKTSCPVCGENKIESGKWYRPEGFAPLVVAWDTKKDRAAGAAPKFSNMKAKIADHRDDDVQNSGGVKLPAPLSSEEIEILDLVPLKGTSTTQKLEPHEQQLLSSFHDRVKIRTSQAKGNGATDSIDLIIINSGYQSQGYYVCPDCGKLDLQANGPISKTEGHDRPYACDTKPHQDDPDFQQLKADAEDFCKTGRMMSDGLQSLYLGMTFKTDMILITFKIEQPLNNAKTAILNRSLNDGVRAIKEALITEIQKVKKFINREIGGGLRKHTMKDEDDENVAVFDIFLYDDVSGGAGLTTSLFDGEKGYQDFVEILKRVELRLSGKLCMDGKGCDKACVGCLLDFRNKREHDSLDRRNGLRILRYLINGDPPTIESGNPKSNPDEELDRLVQLLGGDLAWLGPYEVSSDNGTISISIKGNNLKIRPISEMVLPRFDSELNKYLSVNYRERRTKIFDFGNLLNSGVVNKNSLDGKEMIYLSISKFYSNRQEIASSINKIMNKKSF